MIKSIILDVDGVIVGEKEGYNFPYPNPDVIARLKVIQNRGIPISLCSAKANFSLDKIIKDANLNNLHITDGGAVIIDPISGRTEGKHLLTNSDAIELVKFSIDSNIQTEVYSINNWYVQNGLNDPYTLLHEKILQREAIRIDDLAKYSEQLEITKIILITESEDAKINLDKALQKFSNKFKLSWTFHPSMLPTQFAIITAPGISKKNGAMEISKFTGIPLENTLGVGDTISDWQFIEICGYGASMGNGTEELKKFIKTLGQKGYIGKSVDENGILEIFDHFEL